MADGGTYSTAAPARQDKRPQMYMSVLHNVERLAELIATALVCSVKMLLEVAETVQTYAAFG